MLSDKIKEDIENMTLDTYDCCDVKHILFKYAEEIEKQELLIKEMMGIIIDNKSVIAENDSDIAVLNEIIQKAKEVLK
jgi:hypothetical protein